MQKLHPQPAGNVSGAAHRYINDPRSVQKLLSDPDVKTSVNRNDVRSGGVPKDGIPSLDYPQVVSVADVPQWLDRDGDGIGVSFNGHHRFYPYQILVNHEIVNDIVGETPLLVTYCPLCYTGIVYNPVRAGMRTTFGVSGVLLDSNLVMYNRSHPESLWSQARGEAIIGPLTGEMLNVYPFDITTLEQFMTAHPDATVVVGDKEQHHIYDGRAYGGDLRNPNLRFPNAGEGDKRLAPTERVVGLIIGNTARAYPIETIKRTAPFDEDIDGKRVRVTWDHDLGAVRIYEIRDSTQRRLPLRASFWFSWVATHPATTLYHAP